MAAWNLWGIHPKTGVASLFALRMPLDMIGDIEARAKADGWTDLQWGLWTSTLPEECESKSTTSDPEPSSGKKRRQAHGGSFSRTAKRGSSGRHR
jgi:hypothetical protein